MYDDLESELQNAVGLSEPTKPEEPKQAERVPAEKKSKKQDDLIRVTIRITPKLEEKLYRHQRKLRSKGVSKRDSSFNAIIVEAIEEKLSKSRKL